MGWPWLVTTTGVPRLAVRSTFARSRRTCAVVSGRAICCARVHPMYTRSMCLATHDERVSPCGGIQGLRRLIMSLSSTTAASSCGTGIEPCWVDHAVSNSSRRQVRILPMKILIAPLGPGDDAGFDGMWTDGASIATTPGSAAARRAGRSWPAFADAEQPHQRPPAPHGPGGPRRSPHRRSRTPRRGLHHDLARRPRRDLLGQFPSRDLPLRSVGLSRAALRRLEGSRRLFLRRVVDGFFLVIFEWVMTSSPGLRSSRRLPLRQDRAAALCQPVLLQAALGLVGDRHLHKAAGAM